VPQPGLDSGMQFPASLHLARILKGIAWLVSILASIVVVSAVRSAMDLAFPIAVACIAVFIHLLLYAAADMLIIAVAVERNTRIAASMLRRSALAGSRQGPEVGRASDDLALDGGDALAEAILKLSAKHADDRESAAEYIGRLGAHGRNAIDALEAALNDPDRRVRSRVARAIAEVRRRT